MFLKQITSSTAFQNKSLLFNRCNDLYFHIPNDRNVLSFQKYSVDDELCLCYKGCPFKACVRFFFFFLNIFSPNYSPLKNMKKRFILSNKLFSFLRYSTFCHFFPFLSTISRFKRLNGSRIIYDVML